LEYQITELVANAAPITGRFFAHNRLSRVERAFLAADLVTGATRLAEPTVVQAAILAGVNRTSAGWAKQAANRPDIIRGLLPLVPRSSLTRAQIDDHVIVDLVNRVGIDHLLAVMSTAEAAHAHH
jgi:hypothetical protein